MQSRATMNKANITTAHVILSLLLLIITLATEATPPMDGVIIVKNEAELISR